MLKKGDCICNFAQDWPWVLSGLLTILKADPSRKACENEAPSSWPSGGRKK